MWVLLWQSASYGEMRRALADLNIHIHGSEVTIVTSESRVP